MSESIHDYLPRNRIRAAEMRGQRLAAVERLTYEPLDTSADEEARFAWGPLLLTSTTSREWLIDAEESKANILILGALESAGPWYTNRRLRIPVATARADDPLQFLLTEPIASIEVISRKPEPGVTDSFAMCGLRLTMANGGKLCIGTHLDEDPYPEVAVRLPDEVAEDLEYTEL